MHHVSLQDMPTSDPIDSLLAHRNQFRAFLVARVRNESDADDLLQTGLLKAMQTSETIRAQEKVIAWFYRLLRNAIIDHHRASQARSVRDDAWTQHAEISGEESITSVLCLCYRELLPKLSDREANLIRRVELGDESVAAVAAEYGISANSASISLYRARKKLRTSLIEFCGSCASSGCRDCSCKS
jgi:RNA polymerase sigma-70 factor (ECF subfamily)